jgi:hypothetical protein
MFAVLAMFENELQAIRCDITALEGRILDLKRTINHSSDFPIHDDEKKAISMKIHQLKDYLQYVEAESQTVVGKNVPNVNSICSSIYYTCDPLACVTRIGPSSWVTSIHQKNIVEGESFTIYDAQFHQPVTVVARKRNELNGVLQLHSQALHFEGYGCGLPGMGDKVLQAGIVEVDGEIVPILCESQWYTTKFDKNGLAIGKKLFKGCVGGGSFSVDCRTLYGIYAGADEEQEVGLYASLPTL